MAAMDSVRAGDLVRYRGVVGQVVQVKRTSSSARKHITHGRYAAGNQLLVEGLLDRPGWFSEREVEVVDADSASTSSDCEAVATEEVSS